MLLWHEHRPQRAPAAKLSARCSRTGKYIAPALLIFASAMPLLPGIANAYIDLGVLIMTYVMLGWGLNIVVGLAGLLDLGYVAFYAVGAYSFALLSENFGLGFWECLPISGLLAALWGVCLGFPVLRLRGDYLAIVTLAFGEIIRLVITNWVSLTGGPNGITDIPHPTLFGLTFSMAGGPGTFAGFFHIDPDPKQRTTYLYYIILALALLTNWVRCGCASSLWAAPGRRCARMRSPAARSASICATPSSPPSPSAPCSAASPAASSPPARPSSARTVSPSSNPPPCSPSSYWAVPAASSAWCLPPA